MVLRLPGPRTARLNWWVRETGTGTKCLFSAGCSPPSVSPPSAAEKTSASSEKSSRCLFALPLYLFLEVKFSRTCNKLEGRYINSGVELQTHTCMLLMASCSCSRRWAELKASKRMSVSLRSFSHSSVRSSVTTLSSPTSPSSPPSESLQGKRKQEENQSGMRTLSFLSGCFNKTAVTD